MTRLLPSLGLVAALAVTLPAVGGASAPLSGASSARAAANTQTYQDSTNEDPQGPDIKSITVSNDNTGLITFAIDVPNQASLSGEKIVDLSIDADNNTATGDPDPLDPGADYAIELFQNQVNLFQWDGTNFSRTASGPSQASLVFTNGANGPSISISNVELGNTKQFKFNVLVASGLKIDASGNLDATDAHADFAPDLTHGFYSYVVKTAKLKLLARKFHTVPGRPKAGALYSVRMTAVRNDTGAALASGTVTCTAKIGGKAVTARTHRIANKEAQCAWLIPRSARGKRITGSIAVVFEGQKVTKPFSAPIG